MVGYRKKKEEQRRALSMAAGRGGEDAFVALRGSGTKDRRLRRRWSQHPLREEGEEEGRWA